ncbi:MAG: hypothetical protein D4Q77_03330 [Methanothrix sp.]|nr:MAG: hypothetical protein D4Q77_03330 [Methanothrix sp.]
MGVQINLEFTDRHKYHMEFSPAGFWKPFAESYSAIEWEEQSDDRLTIVAENYTYLLDLLVQARLYYISTKPYEERFK